MIALEQNIVMLALALVAMVIIVLLIFAMRIKSNGIQQRKELAVMKSDLRALCNSAVQMGERLNKTGVGLKTVQHRQQELGVRQEKIEHSEPQEVSFEQAIKLARKGSSVEELMDLCKLSQGEAELITMMHRLDPTDYSK